jgi:2-amino-4-hydroxy-6-hydroxymethyldihydropteridine diphosphokinase
VEKIVKEHKAVVAIGSNSGNRKENIRTALKSFASFCHIDKYSKAYKTKPYGNKNQPDFINMAVLIETSLSPTELLDKLLEIETHLGRERTIHWGERTIDLDIIFYDNLVIQTENLTIPHPDMQNRDFVLKPLMDICPDWEHPVLKKKARKLT